MLHQGLIHAWQTPELTSLNKLPPRASFDLYPDRRRAVAGRRDKSPWFQGLNGEWDFCYFESPVEAQRVATDAAAGKRATWARVPVPGNWQVAGYHFPHYTNVNMPFAESPPFTPERNPTGVYRRSFAVPTGWAGRRVVLHFGSADSVLAVYVDGVAVGLSKDARLPAEFDVTALVRPGATHELTAVVVQYSDASFVEDQDMWRLGGLPREVYLWASPKIYVADVRATPEVDLARGTAELEVVVKGGFPGNQPVPGTRVTVRLLDPEGREVTAKPATAEVEHHRWSQGFELGMARLRVAVPKARLRLWSHETPTLYTVVVSLEPSRESGEPASHTAVRTGFRRVEVRGRNLLINDRRVLIKGVNHHEHDPDHGKAVALETLRRDLVLMKRFNFNAVRLSHYPHDPRFLDLCDELGLYAIDEANVESHDFHNTLCQDPAYATAWLDRVMRMVMRDINHPSVIAWSLGNEAGYGASHDAAAGWVRHHDPSRPVHYEGAISRWQSALTWMHGSAATDIICPMYPELSELDAWLDFADRNLPADEPTSYETLLATAPGHDEVQAFRQRPDKVPLPMPLHPLARPLILCEYSHAMGNSNGSLADYYRRFKTRAGIQGGFIWEWLDHGWRHKTEDGREFFAYGGDFGDRPNDVNFVCDGMVSADREPHPACYEHHRLAQPVAVALVSAKGGAVVVRVTNEHDFLVWEKTGLRARWLLLADGEAAAEGEVPGAALRGLAPGESREVRLRLGARPEGARELHLNLSFELKAATAWADAGHVVASEQLELPWPTTAGRREAKPARAVEPTRAVKTADAITLHAGEVTAVFDRAGARLVSLRRGDREHLVRGPALQVWRGATDNDGIRLAAKQDRKALGRWLALGLEAGLEQRATACRVGATRPDGSVTVTLSHEATTAKRGQWGDLFHEHRYTLHADGRLEVANVFRVEAAYDDLPRLGVRLDLPAAFEGLSYFGRGPWENYSDRRTAADLAVWETTVRGDYVEYVMPQEHGHHTDVRWVELAAAGRTPTRLRVEGAPTLEFNATHFDAEHLFACRHTTDLKPRAETLLYLDVAQRGLGTGSCGPDALPEHRVRAGRHRLAFVVRV